MNNQLMSQDIMGDIQLATIEADRRERVIKIRDSIDITNTNEVMKLGADVSKDITNLNKSVLTTVKIKDIPEIEAILPQLTDAFKEVDSTSLMPKKQNFFARLFRGDPAKDFLAKFENAETVVSTIQTNLERVEVELRKDIEFEDSLGQKNLLYIAELEEHIIGMKLKLNEEMAELEALRESTDTNDIVALQMLEERKDQIDGLDKQIFWLEQQRLLAIQTLPILRNLKNNNKDMIRQINLAVTQSIPAWEQSIIIALHIHRQQGALRIERAVHDMTNDLVKQNSRMLKENSVEIVKAVQGGMIDMETFREANNNLIETSRQITEAKNLAINNRTKNIEEYRKLTNQLLEAERRDITALASARVVPQLTD